MKAVGVLAGVMLASTQPAHASDHGCKVLLCLANPQGPTAVAECIPPIKQLWHDLAHGKPFPSCGLVGNGGGTFAQQGASYYDPCPAGTLELAQGVIAIQGTGPIEADPSTLARLPAHTGVGSGDQLNPEDYARMPSKVCVGNYMGDMRLARPSTDEYGFDYTWVTAQIYDRVILQDPQDSPRIIDVYVDSALYRRVRW